MKFKLLFRAFSLFLFFKFSFQFTKISQSNDTQLLSSVFSDAIREIFFRFHLEFDLIVYGKVSPHIFEVLKGIQTSENPTKIIYTNTHGPLLKPAIILCESFQKIEEFFKHHDLLWRKIDFPERFRFLIYAEKSFNATKIGVNPFDSDSGHASQFSYFIVNYKGKKLESYKYN